MYQEITEILELWMIGANRTTDLIERAKRAYTKITGQETNDCVKCQSKWINELQKWQHKQSNIRIGASGRQYLLKPGNHAFIPGPSQFNNENLTDEACKIYLRLYPHIRSLFIKLPS